MGRIFKSMLRTRLHHMVALVLWASLIHPAHSIILGFDDTDEASRERARSYPYVCLISTDDLRCSGVLIHKGENTSWVLTVAHILQNKDHAQVHIKMLGRRVGRCQEIIFPDHGHRSLPSWEIKKDLALLRIMTKDWFPEPLAFFDPYKISLDYDPCWKIWRGEGHIIGYGHHVHTPNELTLDDQMRHATTPFFVDAARDHLDNGCGFWSIISCMPYGQNYVSQAVPGTEKSIISSHEEVTFSTYLTRDSSTQRLGFSLDKTPDQIPMIEEIQRPLQGTTTSGDSGGPLIVTHEGVPYLLGIAFETLASTIIHCHHAYYAPIPYFSQWIQQAIMEQYVAIPTSFQVLAPPFSHHYIDHAFVYQLKKKSYTGDPSPPPLGLHSLSMDTKPASLTL